MTKNNLINIFESERALLSGHFLLSSGLHSPTYFQCALLLQKPWVAEKLCKQLATRIKALKIRADVVVGPAMGGITAAYELGRAMKVRALFAERAEDSFCLRRGFEVKKSDRVIIVEDVVTTGKSSLEVVKMLHASKAKVVAVACMVDRTGGKNPFQVPLVSLMSLDVITYDAGKCPICAAGKIPLSKPGSRKI